MLDQGMRNNSNIKSVMLAKGGKSTGVVEGKMYDMGLTVKSALLKFTLPRHPAVIVPSYLYIFHSAP